MTVLNITLPGPLAAFVAAEVARRGYRDASEYVRALIEERQTELSEEELEAEIQAGLDSPMRELTPEDWKTHHKRLDEKLAQRRS